MYDRLITSWPVHRPTRYPTRRSHRLTSSCLWGGPPAPPTLSEPPQFPLKVTE